MTNQAKLAITTMVEATVTRVGSMRRPKIRHAVRSVAVDGDMAMLLGTVF
ncbi:MAG TPA: hypothetical protein VIL58_09255 [Thermoplasmata archaeon]